MFALVVLPWVYTRNQEGGCRGLAAKMLPATNSHPRRPQPGIRYCSQARNRSAPFPSAASTVGCLPCWPVLAWTLSLGPAARSAIFDVSESLSSSSTRHLLASIGAFSPLGCHPWFSMALSLCYRPLAWLEVLPAAIALASAQYRTALGAFRSQPPPVVSCLSSPSHGILPVSGFVCASSDCGHVFLPKPRLRIPFLAVSRRISLNQTRFLFLSCPLPFPILPSSAPLPFPLGDAPRLPNSPSSVHVALADAEFTYGPDETDSSTEHSPLLAEHRKPTGLPRDGRPVCDGQQLMLKRMPSLSFRPAPSVSHRNCSAARLPRRPL